MSLSASSSLSVVVVGPELDALGVALRRAHPTHTAHKPACRAKRAPEGPLCVGLRFTERRSAQRTDAANKQISVGTIVDSAMQRAAQHHTALFHPVVRYTCPFGGVRVRCTRDQGKGCTAMLSIVRCVEQDASRRTCQRRERCACQSRLTTRRPSFFLLFFLLWSYRTMTTNRI